MNFISIEKAGREGRGTGYGENNLREGLVTSGVVAEGLKKDACFDSSQSPSADFWGLSCPDL